MSLVKIAGIRHAAWETWREALVKSRIEYNTPSQRAYQGAVEPAGCNQMQGGGDITSVLYVTTIIETFMGCQI